MTQEKPSTYAAMITISLPGTDKTATASVVLAADDTILTGKQIKPLRECTLAELQTFANNWEADVWATYEEINLLDLDEAEQVDVDVTRMSESGDESLPDWADHAIIIPAAEQAPPETEAEAEPELEPEPDETPAAEEAESAEESAAEETAVTEPTAVPPTPAAESESDDVHVSVSEPLADEEDEEDEKSPSLPHRPEVRIAGQALTPGHPTWAAADVFIDEPALRAAQAHALSSPNREVAGVLVGPRPEKQPDGRYHVYVTDTIIAKYTVMQGASVTYTPESWRYMNDQLNERYPDETAVMVGWYHTHPGFGIFLSGMDLFIHQNFFTQMWHVALVLDPIAKTGGFFCWDRQQTRVNRYDFIWPAWSTNW